MRIRENYSKIFSFFAFELFLFLKGKSTKVNGNYSYYSSRSSYKQMDGLMKLLRLPMIHWTVS